MNFMLENDLSMRTCRAEDHPGIIAVMVEWWDGRDLVQMLPRLFLNHFANTSFLVEKEEKLIGFLVGFFSQTRRDEGYVHFTGVHPEYRGRGIGEAMYSRFFAVCHKNGIQRVRACTSPVNTGSIAFHRCLGFSVQEGNDRVNGVAVTRDYNRPGDHKVLFVRELPHSLNPRV